MAGNVLLLFSFKETIPTYPRKEISNPSNQPPTHFITVLHTSKMVYFCGFCVLTDLLFMEKVAGVKILCYINVFTVMKTNILGTVEIS